LGAYNHMLCKVQARRRLRKGAIPQAKPTQASISTAATRYASPLNNARHWPPATSWHVSNLNPPGLPPYKFSATHLFVFFPVANSVAHACTPLCNQTYASTARVWPAHSERCLLTCIDFNKGNRPDMPIFLGHKDP
jgi:hypothetical protein